MVRVYEGNDGLMTTIRILDREGTETAHEAEAGVTIMEIIRNAGYDEVLALCGGQCACATCHVYVDDEYFGRLPPMSEDEHDLLDSSDHRQANSRLSCQLEFSAELAGLRLQIGPEE